LWKEEQKRHWKEQKETWHLDSVQQKWLETVPAFAAPFRNADEFMATMEEPALYKYLSGINDFIGTDAFEVEFESVMLRLEKELSLRSQSDVERAGYRSALLFLREFKKRLTFLGNKFNELDRDKGRAIKEQMKNL